METKNSLVRRLVAAKEYKKALQICKDWDYKDPTHKKRLSLGYECHLYPRFYEQLGIDTEKAYKDAIEILEFVYRDKGAQ